MEGVRFRANERKRPDRSPTGKTFSRVRAILAGAMSEENAGMSRCRPLLSMAG